MKATIAKILSLFTVLLLGSNIVLSSVPQSSVKPTGVSRNSDGSVKYQSFQNDLGSTFIEVNFENDTFEDFELLSDLTDNRFGVIFLILNESDRTTVKYEAVSSFRENVPRWLWVRHILI